MASQTKKHTEYINLQVGDLPVIYELLKSYGLIEIVDKHVTRHANWKGISSGNLLAFWVSYMLSTGDHYLSSFESWGEHHIVLLSALANSENLLSVKDFADDRLEKLLDYLSVESTWRFIESDLNSKILSVYCLKELNPLPTIRTDAAPMQSYGQVKSADGLLQRGYSKHHNSKCAQFKVKLSTLDNELNQFAYPLCHLTVSGEKSDDVLYIPIIKQSQQNLRNIKGYEQGNLYVGDSKMGSKAIRAYVAGSQDYYLCPLSKVQLSVEQRLKAIKAVEKQGYEQVTKTIEDANGKQTTQEVAVGFERLVTMTSSLEENGELTYIQWQERQLFVRSSSYAQAQEKSFEKKLSTSCEQLNNLPIRKKGKKVLHTLQEVRQTSQQILEEHGLCDFLSVSIQQKVHEKKVRAYGSKAARVEKTTTFSLKVTRNQTAIEEHKQLLGWQVYATNTPKKLLSFEKCVWKYRYQSNIERRFDDLRNRVMKLLPLYLKKDNRIEALVNICILGLKICSAIEYKAAKTLKDSGKKLAGLYDGNPRRKTRKPSAKRLLNAFKFIGIGLFFTNKELQNVGVSKLDHTQIQILKILDIDVNIYTTLEEKIQIFFSDD